MTYFLLWALEDDIVYNEINTQPGTVSVSIGGENLYTNTMSEFL